MKSLRFKVMLPVIIMVVVFIAIIYVQIASVRSSLKMITEMNEKYFATLSKAESLKLDVVQVQQWLTDISATRAAKGYDDGFTEAEKHAQNVKTILNELEKMDPEQKEELDKIGQDFEPYYEMGKKMADAYISGGPLKGNETMGEFDKTAEAINNSVDSFKEKSTERITYSMENIKKSVQNSIVLAVISIIVVIALLAFAAMYITKAIVRPIKRLERQFNELAENGGDLTQQIEISSKDEIGHLASSVNRFIDNLRTVMIEVNKTSNSVEETANSVFKSLIQLDANIEETSSTVEELSAGMEETAAEAEQVNVSSEQMESYIESIARKAQNGAAASVEISMKANELKSNTIKSEQRAQEIYEEAKEKLETALEQSKAVEKINILSEAILQISSQTNLLALNASIESARAGEAGRGFAVVANEIRKLAEDSKTTVNEIQRITKEVVSSVENLSSGAKVIMEFMEVNVRSDYEGMLKTGEHYSNDAVLINKLVTDFSGTAEELTTSIEEIAKAISNVAKTVDEGAAGTQNMAEKTSEIAKQVSLVRNQMQISMESSQRLRDVVDKFVV